MRRAIISRTGCSPRAMTFRGSFTSCPVSAAKIAFTCWHRVHIFGINVNLGGAAGNRPAHILIGNTGAAMQHQRNLHLLGNGFHLGKSQPGFTFIQTMGGAQRGGEAIHWVSPWCSTLRIGVDDFGIDNAVFTAGDGPQFGLHRDTLLWASVTSGE